MFFKFLFPILLLPFATFAQTELSVVVKTRPFTDIVLESPNFQLEMLLLPRFSVEAEGIWRRRVHDYSGGDIFGRFYEGNGFTAGVIPKYYLINSFPDAPRGYYIAGLIRYNYTSIPNLRLFNNIPFGDPPIIYKYSRGAELGIITGGQAIAWNRIAFDLCFGFGNYWQNNKAFLLQGDPPRGYVNGRRIWTGNKVNVYLFLSIGYHFYVVK